MITKAAHWIAKYAASSYIAGSEVEDAIRVCRQIAERGFRSTICPWDGPQDSPENVASTYKAALNSIKTENLDCYLSIKAPSIKYNFKVMTELVKIAHGHGVRIHFDSLAPDTASPSLAFLERALEIYPHVSYTLPSKWTRSIADAEILVDLGVPVRIVKGQWPDPMEPNIDPRSHFLDLVDSLAGRAKHVAIATHDASLAKESLSRLRKSGTVCELEQLYGLPLRVDSVARPLGIPARVYVPYGHAYLSYALSEMRKRPIILAWLFKDFLAGVNKKIHQSKQANSNYNPIA